MISGTRIGEGSVNFDEITSAKGEHWRGWAQHDVDYSHSYILIRRFPLNIRSWAPIVDGATHADVANVCEGGRPPPQSGPCQRRGRGRARVLLKGVHESKSSKTLQIALEVILAKGEWDNEEEREGWRKEKDRGNENNKDWGGRSTMDVGVRKRMGRGI